MIARSLCLSLVFALQGVLSAAQSPTTAPREAQEGIFFIEGLSGTSDGWPTFGTLCIISAFDFINTQPGAAAGDLFIDSDGDSALETQASAHQGYNWVLDFKWDEKTSSGGTEYTVPFDLVELVQPPHSAGESVQDAQVEPDASRWRYDGGGKLRGSYHATYLSSPSDGSRIFPAAAGQNVVTIDWADLMAADNGLDWDSALPLAGFLMQIRSEDGTLSLSGELNPRTSPIANPGAPQWSKPVGSLVVLNGRNSTPEGGRFDWYFIKWPGGPHMPPPIANPTGAYPYFAIPAAGCYQIKLDYSYGYKLHGATVTVSTCPPHKCYPDVHNCVP